MQVKFTIFLTIQVRKAAYQSLGAFISTFYIPNGNGSLTDESLQQQQDESSLCLLSDSILQDNSLLDTAHGDTLTLDSSSEHRHPLPDGSVTGKGAISNSSTPIHASNGGNGTISGFEKLVQDPTFSNFEFWRSPIPGVMRSGELEQEVGDETERSKVTSEVGTRGA